jgi:repressor LexA
MLTAQQKKLLEFLSARAAVGTTPSFEEMMGAMGLKSKSGVHRLVGGLEERGYIKRSFNKARAIEVLRPVTDVLKAVASDFVRIPRYGYIAAGTPIEAISSVHEHLTIPTKMIGTGDHYALTVRGDSMIDAGILEGDLVLIEQTPTARKGEIVVALVRQEEATLKFYEPKGQQVILRPANANYEPQTYAAKEVEIQGKLKAVWRHY